jgi:hypothetical protein
VNRHLTFTILSCSVVFWASTAVQADIPGDQFDGLYSSLKGTFTPTDMGDPMMAIESSFNKAVPEPEQANVIAKLIERAARVPSDEDVLFNAMHLAQFKRPDGASPWNEQLQTALLAQEGNHLLGIRWRIVEIFLSHPDANYRDKIIPLIYSLLRVDDDHQRVGLLDDLIRSKWPETKEICETYVRNTPLEAKHKESVLTAKAFLSPDDVKRAEELTKLPQSTETQKAYLAYVALHRGDPDYEVSVDVVERWYKSNQDNLDYFQSLADDKTRAAQADQLLASLNAGLPLPVHSFQEQQDLFYFLFSNSDYSPYNSSLRGPNSPTVQKVWEIYNRAVPLKDRARLLCALAERANKNPINNAVIEQVMSWADPRHRDYPQTGVWSRELEKCLCLQTKNPDQFIRLNLLLLLDNWSIDDPWHRSNSRAVILAFLNDDESEMIRENALSVIARWPDGKQLLSKYTKDHLSDPARHSTVFAIQEVMEHQ